MSLNPQGTSRKFLFLGCGAVAKCVVNYLDKYISNIDYTNVLIVDMVDLRNVPCLQEIYKRGASFYKFETRSGDYEPLFNLLRLQPFDVVIDLTTSTNGLEIVKVCREMSLILINTSHEIESHFTEQSTLYDVSLWKRHVDVDNLNKTIEDPSNVTHVYDFGMNPGIISHMVFHGLTQIAKKVLQTREDEKLSKYVDELDYKRIARHLKLEVIHCSELDTQYAKNISPDSDEFINTWSVIGMLEEGCEPSQVGWGTHEKSMPDKSEMIGPHHLAIDNPSYQQFHYSYVPDQEIIGVVIGHGEACTLPMYLSVDDYAPTVHYVYKLCRQTRELLKKNTYEELLKIGKWRVLNPAEDDLEGEDRVGALLIFKENPITGEKKPWTFWVGSILGQELSKTFGPTVLQVMSAVLTALKYAIENPQKGGLFPEDLPNEYVIKNVAPYMGKFVCQETPWVPVSTQFTEMAKVAAEKLKANPELL